MRFGLVIFTLTLGILLIGGTCQPFTDTLARTPAPGQTVSITLSKPATDATIVQGTPVSVEWAAANLTGEPGTATFRVESRLDPNLSPTSLPDTIEVGAQGSSGTLTWDTTSFVGPYAIIGRIQAGGQTREATAVGRITVDAPPILEFTAPPGDVTFDPNKTLSIEWQAHDESATGRLGLDPDTEHGSGNEIYIHDFTVGEPNSPSSTDGSSSEGTGLAKRRGTGKDNQGGGSEPELVADSFKWDGTDSNGNAVDPGTYNLFASVTDNVNDVLYVDGLGQITIPKPITDPNESQSDTPQITDPNSDTTFLTNDPNGLKVTYEVNQSSDALVDLKIDTDDDHANGNERTIMSQQFVAADTTPDPFSWNGNDASGAAVGPGIYRLYLSISTGTGTPTTTDGSGLVFRRSDPNQPLIALLEPSATTHIDPGQTLLLTWRDDDPNDPNGMAKIRIVIANSPNPDDPVTNTPILSNRAASDDGVRDTFAWQVPLSSGLAVGTVYYVIAHIENEDADLKSSSVAGGRIMLNDPNTP
jgi:flagellar hook assembly protein FlgD